jgi:hypothetical protein
MTPGAFLISSSFAADVDEHLPDGADEQPEPTLPNGRRAPLEGFDASLDLAPRIGGGGADPRLGVDAAAAGVLSFQG